MAAAPPLAAVDRVASATCDEDLAVLLADGTELADRPIRCAASDPDREAHRRLDLALRMLRSQPQTHWCRAAGAGTAVVLRWPLPARGIALYTAGGGEPVLLVLAVGRAGGAIEVWRFRWDHEPQCSVGARARALLDGLA